MYSLYYISVLEMSQKDNHEMDLNGFRRINILLRYVENHWKPMVGGLDVTFAGEDARHDTFPSQSKSGVLNMSDDVRDVGAPLLRLGSI